MASELLPIDKEALAALDPEERKEFEGMLSELQKSLDENPLSAYQPYDKQRLYLAASERIRGLFGGNRTGKSTTGTAGDLIDALPLELVPPHLREFKRYGFDSPFKGRVITPDLGHTMAAALEKFREMAPPGALRGGSWDKAYDKAKRVLHFARGDLIDFMSTEQDPDKFGAVARHRVRFDEEPSGPHSWAIFRDSWMRLTDYKGDIAFTMTPLLGVTWVNDEIWEKRTQDGIFAIQMSMRDNPYLDPSEIDLRLSILSNEERRAVEHGEFVHFEGKFFPEFSARHIIEPPAKADIATQEIVCSIDPGRQTGIVWNAFDRDNKATAFAEAFLQDQSPDEIAQRIRATNSAWGVEAVYVIDPAARSGHGASGESWESAFVREEIYCQLGQNDRAAGILEMKRRFQATPPEHVISKSLERLLWEIPRYRRDANSTKDFDAVKKDDHEIDADRYGLMSRTWRVPEVQTRGHSNFNSFTHQPPYEAPRPPAPPLGIYS